MKIFPIMALVGFLISLDAGIHHWRSTTPVSSAPVFSLPLMEKAMTHPGEFQASIDTYHADRGGELKLPGPGAASLTLFYFEWDRIAIGPIMDISGHTPEQCNVAAGFTLNSRDPQRVFETPDHSPLIFLATTFADPGGRIVHVYKTAWIQGLGSWDILQGQSREARLSRSFLRGRGAARVIQCGVTGAQDESHAWRIFQEQVLGKLAWKP